MGVSRPEDQPASSRTAPEAGRDRTNPCAPVQYVSNIYKYYVAYKMAAEQAQLREKAKQGLGVK